MLTSPSAPIRLTQPASAYCTGDVQFQDSDLAAIAKRQGASAAWIEAFARYDVDAPNKVRGDFAVVVYDRHGRTFLAVDRFSIHSLCFRAGAEGICFHPRADIAADSDGTLEPQAIFDYLYFHVVPAPRTIFRDVQRVPAGHFALFEADQYRMDSWWKPAFVEDTPQSFDDLRTQFLDLLRAAILRQLDGKRVGCFLSGGTDSSTVAGMLTDVGGRPASSFSIGFDAAGYDEMAYARIAARHFGTEHHEYYVTPDDLVASISDVARYYDQPFGNSSVVPAYYCAKVAREAGIEKMLGGDGGDELFGGNSRYAKQRVFAAYQYVPRFLRANMLEPILSDRSPISRLPLLRKAASYIEQARAPMPDRMQMYNLLSRLGLPNVLTPEFLSAIDPHIPLALERKVYSATNGRALINQMLAFDWRFTLADNDLPKVVGAAAFAGIPVGFPLLDDALTDFSLQLEPKLKLRGLELRWFFKKALRGFLPDAIIAKKKHGFGMPFGVWVNRNADLKALAFESIRSLGGRGIVRTDFLRQLELEYLPRHPGYYGEMVWILMILEQWLRGHHHHAPSGASHSETTAMYS